jgi:hypothetical protein
MRLQEKGVYREAYARLRDVKREVEGVQAALGHARVRLQRDFQAWHAAMAQSSSKEGGSASGPESAVPSKLSPQEELQDWLIPAGVPGGDALQRDCATTGAAAAQPSVSPWTPADSSLPEAQPGAADCLRTPVLTGPLLEQPS